jgi:hypothetical protein
VIRYHRIPIGTTELMRQSRLASGSYNTPEVCAGLETMFYNKCYLCEMKPVLPIDIDHLLPHRGNADVGRKFDWNNLFLSCTRCNRIKNDLEPILDPTDSSKQVLSMVKYAVSTAELNFSIQTLAQVGSTEAINTANLLNQIFSGNTDRQKWESRNLRESILSEVKELNRHLQRFRSASASDIRTRCRLKYRILDFIQPGHSFTSIHAWILIHENLATEFAAELRVLGYEVAA